MNKTFLGAFLASVFISFTACSEENFEQDTNPPTEQPGDSTDPDDSGEDQLPEYPTPDLSLIHISRYLVCPPSGVYDSR